jgi:hypothetical protein
MVSIAGISFEAAQLQLDVLEGLDGVQPLHRYSIPVLVCPGNEVALRMLGLAGVQQAEGVELELRTADLTDRLVGSAQVAAVRRTGVRVPFSEP